MSNLAALSNFEVNLVVGRELAPATGRTLLRLLSERGVPATLYDVEGTYSFPVHDCTK